MSVELTSIHPIDPKGPTNAPSMQYDNPAFTGVHHANVDDVKVDLTTNENIREVPREENIADDNEMSRFSRVVFRIQCTINNGFKRHKSNLLFAFYIILLVLYFAYFAWAMSYEFGDEGSIRLLVCTIIGVIIVVTNILSTVFKSTWSRSYQLSIKPVIKSTPYRRFLIVMSWFLKFAALTAIVAYIIYDVAIDYPENLVSVAGLTIYVLLCYIFSVNPSKVKWHPVFWGIALQYIFAFIILRWEFGYRAFKYLGDRVTEFLNLSDKGAIFVFGDNFMDHFFAFKVLPIVIFFYTVISVMYYLGAMQYIVRVIGRVLAFCMGTTAAESLNAAGNIFVGMTEAPLMIKPFLKDMTMSEIHAVMTGGFATIAGSVLGAYISFGVPANHLMSASVMSAPAALAISKLTYPECEKSKASSKDFYRMEKSKDRNIIEAAASGAMNSTKVVAAIAVNVLAFVSLIEFLNVTLQWLGERVGREGVTFQFICSYLFFPIAYFMGTEPKDCRMVAELIGIKTFANEFVAYRELSIIISNKQNFTDYTVAMNYTDWMYQGDNIILPQVNQTLINGILSSKSEVVATYALCGFSNMGSMGILLGSLTALVPSRKGDFSKIILRAMISGNIACFLTGCIAGLLYKDYGV